jgi:hypothetical protein
LALNASFNVLEIATAATLCHMRAWRNTTIGRRFKNGDQLTTAKVLLFFG